MSPLGAVRMARGPSSPRANGATVKPAGTLGAAPSGGATTLAWAAFIVWSGGGRSPTVTRCTTPGASSRQSPNTALPAGLAPGLAAGAGAGCEQAEVAAIAARATPPAKTSERAVRDGMARSW